MQSNAGISAQHQKGCGPKRGKNIVIVTTSFPSSGDGSEAAGSFVADLAEEMARELRIRVVAPGVRTGYESLSYNVEVFRYAAPQGRTLSTLTPYNPRDVLSIFHVLRGGLATTRSAVDADTVGILAMWGLPGGEWARRVAQEKKIDYAVWMLGSDVWSLGRIPVVRTWLARVIREARYAFADGYQLAADAQRIAGVPVDFLPTTRKIEFVDPPAPRARPPFRLLFLGRWHPNKGPDLLLDALALLDDSDWALIDCVEVYGGGPLQALVHGRVAALRARGRTIELGGYLSKPQAESAIARADWLVIPSRIESIPVVFSDAMKMRRPVIATPVGDLPRLLETLHCGVCAAHVDAVSIAQALVYGLKDSPRSFASGVEAAANLFSLNKTGRYLLDQLRVRPGHG